MYTSTHDRGSHTYTNTYIGILYIHTSTQAYILTYTYAHTYPHTYVHTHAYIHACTHTNVYKHFFVDELIAIRM